MKARKVAVGVRSRLAAALERGGLVCSLIGLFRDLSMSKCLAVSPAALSTNSEQLPRSTDAATSHESL